MKSKMPGILIADEILDVGHIWEKGQVSLCPDR
jgi:hypothetical protein